jgi:molybdopterin/thiamine biosynthesis adenylyltransferase
MKKMATSNVLIVGMKGLGVEIGKAMHSMEEGDP